MSLCRGLQKLHRAEGLRLLLFRPFHTAAVTCQEQDTRLSRRSDNVRMFALSAGTSQHSTKDETEIPTLPRTPRFRTKCKTGQPILPGTCVHPSDDEREILVIKDVRHTHPSDPPRKAGPGTMARDLVKNVMGLSDIREEVYGALDEWAAFEVEFPLAATRSALERLRQQGQWHRVIQVTKWMFSKGIGKTHGAYSLLLKAYCMDGRLDEAGELWDRLLTLFSRDMPKSMFFFMANAYRRREMPEKVVEVFEQMESFGMKPDKDLLRRAEEAYQQLNMPEKVELLGKKYALDAKTRRKEKRLMARKALKASKLEKSVSIVGDCDKDCQIKDDKDKIEEHTSVYQGDKRLASSSTDQRVIQLEGSCSTYFETDDDESIVEEEATIIQGKQTLASFSSGRTFNPPEKKKKFKKADSASSVDNEFVEQVIATMSPSNFGSVKGRRSM